MNKRPHSYPVVINTPGIVDTVGIVTASRITENRIFVGRNRVELGGSGC